MRTIPFTITILSMTILAGCADTPTTAADQQSGSVVQAASPTRRDIKVEIFGSRHSLEANLASAILEPMAPTAGQLGALRREIEASREQLGAREYTRAQRFLYAVDAGQANPAELRQTLLDRSAISNRRSTTAGVARWEFSGSRGRLVAVTEAAGGGGVTASILLDCANRPVEGCYDPTFNPEPLIADVAAMQAEVSAQEAAAYAAEAAAMAGVPGDPCRLERMEYIKAVLTFLGSSGSTVFFAATRNAKAAIGGLSATYFALWSVNTALLRWQMCLDQVREDNKRKKPSR